MNVFFDYQAFEIQKIGGVSRSYAELISRLQNLDGCKCKVGVKESDNVHLRECGIVDGIKPLHYTHDRLFGGKKSFKGQRSLTRKVLGIMGHQDDGININQEYCIKQIKRQSFDVFEPTFFDSYFLPYLKDKPFVLTVHDMIPELFPRFFSRDDYQIVQKKKLCPLANRIHVPSMKTKEDLVAILDVDPDKIIVIPHGGPELNTSALTYERLFDFPYVLYVGDRYGYKNFVPFLCAIAKEMNNHKDLRLVCTGKGFSEEEQKLIAELGLRDRVVYCFANNNSFGSLYHYAVAFVYPSAYEGFGMPILEAFAYGCPVMLNDASCFPEVAGDAAVYFSMSEEKTDFNDKFQYMYFMSSEDRAGLIAKGFDRLKTYSWEASAKALFELYNELC